MKKILTLLLILSGLGVSAQQVVQVADINVGAGSSYPSFMTEFNNEMYFSAAQVSNVYEIWKCDGINTPVMIVDSNTNSALIPVSYKVFNGKLYFSYGNQSNGSAEGFWVYDGVNPPTSVANINPSGQDFNTQTSIFTEFNGKLYFGANNGITGYELWEYDGVNAPSLVADINPNANSSSPTAFTIFQNKLYFVASPNTTNSLMVYDGINPPTTIFNNLYSGSLVEMNNKLYFASSGSVFEYDGINTPVNVTPNLGSAQPYSAYDIYNSFFNKVYFSVFPTSGGGGETWQYDGINPISYVGDTLKWIGTSGILYNNEVYFTATDVTYSNELWKYDGTNPPVRLTDINTNGSSTGEKPYAFNDKIYFLATDGITGIELWSFDPLYLTTSKVETATNFSLYPNPTNSNITLQFDQAYTKANIELINTLGQVISNTQSNEMVTTIALPQEKGIYFVRITIDGKSSTQKIVKQ